MSGRQSDDELHKRSDGDRAAAAGALEAAAATCQRHHQRHQCFDVALGAAGGEAPAALGAGDDAGLDVRGQAVVAVVDEVARDDRLVELV